LRISSTLKAMSNGWDFADPVDILPKLPKNFQELIASKKWQERKEALEVLLKLATENIRLDPSANYKEIISTLSKILGKDSNINVCAVAAKCISQIAYGLRTSFSPYAPMVTPVIFEKFKEKKSTLRDPLIEAIDSVYSATNNIDLICDEIASALGKPNPNVKIQTNQFIYRIFKKFNSETAPKKVVKTLTPLIVKCTGESDAEVREAAFCALAAIMNAVGKGNIMPMLGEITNDKIKTAQLEKCFYQVQQEVEEEKKQEQENAGSQGGGGEGGTSEEFLKLQQQNTKLIAEKNEMKTKLDKALNDNKKISQELAKALQKITQMEADSKQLQTKNTSLQQQLTTATKKSETLERNLASRPRIAPAPTTATSNGITRPYTTSTIQARSNSGISRTTSARTTPIRATTSTTTIAAKPISRRSLAPSSVAPSNGSATPSTNTTTTTTGLRLPSRAGSQTSIPISDTVKKAISSGSRLPFGPR
jgi:hypothetical protein